MWKLQALCLLIVFLGLWIPWIRINPDLEFHNVYTHTPPIKKLIFLQYNISIYVHCHPMCFLQYFSTPKLLGLHTALRSKLWHSLTLKCYFFYPTSDKDLTMPNLSLHFSSVWQYCLLVCGEEMLQWLKAFNLCTVMAANVIFVRKSGFFSSLPEVWQQAVCVLRVHPALHSLRWAARVISGFPLRLYVSLQPTHKMMAQRSKETS